MTDGCWLHVAAWATLAALGSSGVSADDVDPLLNAARSSKPLVDLRLRYENIEQDGIPEEADARTLRARLGFETGKACNTSLLAESELLAPLLDDYNSTTNGRTDSPIVNDPQSYEINRLQLANRSIRDTTIIAGRQRVLLDDERFISRVGWRQNEQTFDAVHVINQSIPKLTIDATYFNQVNRVLGKESALGRYHVIAISRMSATKRRSAASWDSATGSTSRKHRAIRHKPSACGSPARNWSRRSNSPI